MLTLIILRHMKTAWALPGQRDIDRDLNDQGREDLARVRQWIKEEKIAPAAIFCSPAARTVQTLNGIIDNFSNQPRIDYQDALYSGFVREYLALIQNVDLANAEANGQQIVLVGHNPSCESLANWLCGNGDKKRLELMSYSYPPGAMAIIDFNLVAWDQITESSGTLRAFYMPNEQA